MSNHPSFPPPGPQQPPQQPGFQPQPGPAPGYQPQPAAYPPPQQPQAPQQPQVPHQGQAPQHYPQQPPPPQQYGAPPPGAPYAGGQAPAGFPGQYPGGPPPGMPPAPGPAGRRGGGSKVPLILAIVLVLALAGGAGAWFLLGSDDDESGGRRAVIDPNTPGGVLWAVQEEAEDSDRVRAFWSVEGAFVKVGGSVLTSYNPADGSVLWTLDLESEHLCVPTVPAADGRVVIGHGESNCSQNITMVDLNSGEQGWTRPLEPVTNPLGFQIAMAGESYAIHTNGGWNLHRTEDGESIMNAEAGYDSLQGAVADPDPLEPREVTQDEQVCAVDGVAGGERLIRRRTCATVTAASTRSVSGPHFMIEEIDPATGDTMWSAEIPEGKWVDKIHSVSPLLVSLRSEEFGPMTDLAVIEGGQITSQFPIANTGIAESDAHLLRDGLCREDVVVYSRVDDCGGIAIQDGVLYVSPDATMGTGTPVTAIDLATGEPLWTHTTEDFAGQLVVGVDEGGVIVHQTGFDEEGGQVIRISPDGQQIEPLFRTGDSWLAGSFFTFFSGGTLVTSPPDYSLEEDIAAYGPEGEVAAAASPSAEE